MKKIDFFKFKICSYQSFFTLKDKTLNKNFLNYYSGNYSRLVAYFRFERQIGHHLIQTFAPSALVVMLSWFSFWLGLDAIPGRVTLLVTSMLTLVTMFTGLKSDIPPVAYVKVCFRLNSASPKLKFCSKRPWTCGWRAAWFSCSPLWASSWWSRCSTCTTTSTKRPSATRTVRMRKCRTSAPGPSREFFHW